MAFRPHFKDLERVARHLPFPLRDTESVNAAFAAWRSQGSAEARRHVEIWTYCYVRRFVLIKFAADRMAPLADFDFLVERIYRKIERKRTSVADPDRYAAWVSVVCRNTYFNHVRSARILVPIEGDASASTPAETDVPGMDAPVMLEALHASIEQLPPYLREVAQLRLIEDLPYEEVARRTGQDPSVLRSYVAKIVKRLRRDERLVRVLTGEMCGTSVEGGYV